jgi:glyoxylase-like metal-dependent hydrolase (beta-lactamase superfamily II)
MNRPMNPQERELDYPLGERLPAPAELVDVAPGVRWLRMPLPFALDHIHLWLLRDCFEGREGWTLVDCGIAAPETRALWQQIEAESLGGLPIVRILCTHMHPDHLGLAAELGERHQAPLWMTLGEYAMGRILSATLPGTGGEASAAHFRQHGLTDAATLEQMRARGDRHFSQLVPAVVTRYRRIHADETIAIGSGRWRVIIGHGHSPEHAALYEAEQRLLISGDMVLPRISTNVSVQPFEPDADPVNDYLASLRRFETCAADTLVLPSHGRPFRGLHTRLRQQHEHHEARLQETLEACRERPMSAMDLLPVLFRRPLDLHQSSFAIGEAIAHLHALLTRGQVRRSCDADGVFRFTAP